MEVKQIKSKERVKDLAEVYTNEREVNAMLDLVNDEAIKIDSKFLEPACGNGNFLIKILERKIKTVAEKYRNEEEYMFYSLKALSCIYAIDICPENVQESRERLLNEIINYYELFFNDFIDTDYINSAKYILERVIIQGNTLEPTNEMIFSDFEISDNYSFIEKRYCFIDLYKEDNEPFEILEAKKWRLLK